MVVASGQLPYQYDGELPVRQRRGGWPGLEVPNIGPSGDLFEQGMFVINAELRKWGVTDLAIQTYKAYTHPDIPGSGFEPKSNGETFVGRPALLATNNIEQMRENLEIYLFEQYAIDSNYSASDFLYSWLTSAYPESPSGYPYFFVNWAAGGIGLEFPATWLRPPLTDVANGDFITDLDLHWLGGSGTLFDIDYGEVIFNPFPFPRESLHFAPSANNFALSFCPIYPLFQTTTGLGPSVDAARYKNDLSTGTFKSQTNFDAIQSGYWQLDGYVLLPGTIVRLTTGNDSNYFGDIGTTTDFSFFVSGQRAVADGAGKNDPTARVYVDATSQSSGIYRITTTNPKSAIPFTSIPSGYASFWPIGDTFSGIFSSNKMLNKSITITSDGGLKIDPRLSTGYHVFNDALWLTSPNAALSGTFLTKGLFVMSPYNGELVWYRPAERIVATSGSMPGGPAPIGSPGIFGVHLGLENFGSNFVRVSKVWNESLVPTDIYTNTVYFQKYDQSTLNYSEQSNTWTLTNSAGSIGASIDGLMFDGTNFWLWNEFGKIQRFSSTLTFTGAYGVGNTARRRHYANGQLLYTIGGNVTVGDPITTMSPAGGSTSGIGVWQTTLDPAVITTDVGTYSHVSAKRLRAETHFGHQSTAVIHSIRDVTGSTHVANGVWMIIQFGQVGHLCKIREDASEWVVEKSIRLDHTLGTFSLPNLPSDFPIEFILHNID